MHTSSGAKSSNTLAGAACPGEHGVGGELRHPLHAEAPTARSALCPAALVEPAPTPGTARPAAGLGPRTSVPSRGSSKVSDPRAERHRQRPGPAAEALGCADLARPAARGCFPRDFRAACPDPRTWPLGAPPSPPEVSSRTRIPDGLLHSTAPLRSGCRATRRASSGLVRGAGHQEEGPSPHWDDAGIVPLLLFVRGSSGALPAHLHHVRRENFLASEEGGGALASLGLSLAPSSLCSLSLS